MSKLPTAVDVVVIGGGPAGAATALRAAQLGHSVCLIERGAKRWHQHFLQSLAPSTLPLLETLGVREEVEARFTRVAGVLLLWSEDHPQRRRFDSAGGLHIERPAFDCIIRRAAAGAGATVVSAATVLEALRDDRRTLSWLVRVAIGGRPFDIHARIIVDAAGRSSGISGLRPRRSVLRSSLPLLSILGQWRSGQIEAGSLVEACDDCWYWAGASGDAVSAAVFLDPRSRLVEKNAPLEQTYFQMLKASRLLRGVLSGRPTHVAACDATSRHVLDPIGPYSIQVGEAALSVDPLSSQGIQTALTAALQAGVVLNTWLRRPSRASAADTFYRERYVEMLQNNRMNSCRIYLEAASRFATPFWRERSISPSVPNSHDPGRPDGPLPDASTPIRLAVGVELRRMAVVRHEFVEFAPAINFASNDRPIAFVNDVPVGELAELVVARAPAVETVRTWSALVGEAAAFRALSWMWQAGVICRHSGRSEAAGEGGKLQASPAIWT